MVKANVYHKKDWTEEDLQEAVNQYWALDPDNCVWAVSKIAASFGVPHQTLDNHIKGKHKPAQKSQRPKQHLSEAEEDVLVDWIQYCSDTAWPPNHHTLTKKVSKVSGKTIGKQWYLWFIAQHPKIRLGKPSGLDPKCAQCFNWATIDDHFCQLQEVLGAKGIHWANVYNMDKKGCQRGGGRRMQAIKYLIPCNQR